MYKRTRIILFTLFVGVIVISNLGTCLETAAASAAADQKFREQCVIARWHVTQKQPLELARKHSIEFFEDHPVLRDGYLTILTSDAQLEQLRQAGLEIEVTNPDWYSSYAARVQVPNGGFRTLAQAIDLMDSIATNYPLITEKFLVGSSYESRPLWMMKISDNPTVDEDEPEILFTGMHHAKEAIGLEVCLETMRRLTDGYGSDTLITRLVNEREIYFLPCLNPDGYEYNLDQFPDGGGLWRKNRRLNIDGTYGVDLNRNYGYQWGYNDYQSSPDPSHGLYRGVNAFSEPETSAIREFVNSHNLVFMINYHSFSRLYLWPWGYERIYTPHEEFFLTVSDSLATYNGYNPMILWTIFRPNGCAGDWAYGETSEHGQIFAIGPEVGTSFWPDPIEIPTLIEENQVPNLVLIDLAENPDRIYPPRVPLWLTPDTMSSSNLELSWSDTASTNPAVSYRLEELVGPYDTTDSAEGGTGLWTYAGMVFSSSRSASGALSYHGGAANSTSNRMVSTEQRLVQPDDVLHMNLWYDIEQGWDYGYVEVSTDGGMTFATLQGKSTTDTDPNSRNRGHGLTGSSGGWITDTFMLAPYVGEHVLIRCSYETDMYVLEEGIYFDDIGPLQAYTSVTELAAAVPDTFLAIANASEGVHAYRIQAQDEQEQQSPMSAPRAVFVVPCYCSYQSDFEEDGFLTAIDLSAMIDILFIGQPDVQDPTCDSPRADFDCDGFSTALDLSGLIDHLFAGGDGPCEPCGLKHQ